MRRGILYAIAAYMSWGLLPLYWKLFQTMGAWEILAHRIVWSVVFVAIILLVTKRWKQMWGAMSGAKVIGAMVTCSLIISVNWLLYIWAVNNGNVMETSLGYYINPLISVLFGVIFLKEKLRVGQWVALGLATIGVTVITFEYGRVPWIAISLALTFALYGLAKKVVKLDAMIGLAWETMFVAPIALGYLLTLQVGGHETVTMLNGWQLVMLTLAGVCTALPLYWFAQSAKNLPLYMIGFMQYLSPTITLLMAVFLFDEPFTTTHLISFAFIWGSVIVFTATTMRQHATPRSMKADLAIKKQA